MQTAKKGTNSFNVQYVYRKFVNSIFQSMRMRACVKGGKGKYIGHTNKQNKSTNKREEKMFLLRRKFDVDIVIGASTFSRAVWSHFREGERKHSQTELLRLFKKAAFNPFSLYKIFRDADCECKRRFSFAVKSDRANDRLFHAIFQHINNSFSKNTQIQNMRSIHELAEARNFPKKKKSHQRNCHCHCFKLLPTGQ